MPLEPMPLTMMSCCLRVLNQAKWGGDRNSKLLNFRLVCTCLTWLFKVNVVSELESLVEESPEKQ